MPLSDRCYHRLWECVIAKNGNLKIELDEEKLILRGAASSSFVFNLTAPDKSSQ